MRVRAVFIEEDYTISSYLAQQTQHAKASVVDLQLWRSWKAAEAVREGVEDIQQSAGHGLGRMVVRGYWTSRRLFGVCSLVVEGAGSLLHVRDGRLSRHEWAHCGEVAEARSRLD